MALKCYKKSIVILEQKENVNMNNTAIFDPYYQYYTLLYKSYLKGLFTASEVIQYLEYEEPSNFSKTSQTDLIPINELLIKKFTVLQGADKKKLEHKIIYRKAIILFYGLDKKVEALHELWNGFFYWKKAILSNTNLVNNISSTSGSGGNFFNIWKTNTER